MFEKEAARLGHLVAFLASYAMFLYNEINVGDNVFAGNTAWHHIPVMSKKKTHLLGVIADGAGRIMFSGKHIEELL